MSKPLPNIALTPGEPAGIGPDLLIQLAQRQWPCQLTAIACPDLLQARAAKLKLPLKIHPFSPTQRTPHQAGTLCVLAEPLNAPAQCGTLNPVNAEYVLRTLTTATTQCLAHTFDALVTGPVHKGVINDAGIAFSGHTEFLAQLCKVDDVVMLLANDMFRVALVTTHLPLRDVADTITPARLTRKVTLLKQGLQQHFAVKQPHIFVAGLNPHAGENGHLGDEEIRIISPTLNALRDNHCTLTGPLSADTLFSKANIQQADAFLCMYHDQGLPVLKYASFGQAANVTLGLPFLRTSVDHGTALTLAGSHQARVDSLTYAFKLAMATKSATDKFSARA